MKKKLFKILIFSFLFGLVYLLGATFIPRSYKVRQLEERANTNYWELKTGSVIGYQKLEGDSISGNNPIIYLHGGPGGKITEEIIELLRPLTKHNFDVYLYDQVGSGHSNRVENIEEYTVERHKRDLEEIVDNIQSEKVILMGQSWGAMLAMEYLADNPDRIEKLIFTGPGPILPINPELSQKEEPDSLNLKAPKYSNKEGNQKAYNLRSKFLRYCATHFGIKMSTDKEADNFFTYLNNELKKSTKCDPTNLKESSGGGGYYAHVMTVRSFREVEGTKLLIKGIEIPTLLIKGQCDNQKWGFAEEYMNLLPNTKLKIIEGAGHIIGKEHQKEFIEIVRNFLN